MTNTSSPRNCEVCGRPSRHRSRCGACRKRQRQHVDRYAEFEQHDDLEVLRPDDLDVLRRRLREHFSAVGSELR